MAEKISKQQALRHYKWGNNCDGWIFVDSEALSVKQESMPAGTAEQLHYHQKARQFFFILKGSATFEVEGQTIEAAAGEGVSVMPSEKHRIINHTAEALEFILCTQPSAAADRINC